MRVRALDSNGDWTFGRGAQNYKSGLQAIQQSIRTRLYSFLGDCFFSLNSGVDWWNLLGSKNTLQLNLAISSMIMNTTGVQQITQISSNLDHDTRQFRVQYTVLTILGLVQEVIASDMLTHYLLTQTGDNLVTQSGDSLIT